MEEVKISNDEISRILEISLRTHSIKEKLESGIYKLIPKRGKSRVWKVYAKIRNAEGVELKEKVACRTCYAVLKHDARSTSNLVRHKCYAMQKYSNPSWKDRDSKMENIKYDTRSISNSIRPKRFAAMQQNNNSEDSTSDDNATNAAAAAAAALPTEELNSDDEKKSILRILSQWFIENCRPLQLADDQGLKRFAEHFIQIGAKFGADVNIENLLPSAANVSRNIDYMFDLVVAKVKHEISENCKYGYGLTSAVWTDNYTRQSYISLTIHYSCEDELCSRVLGLISMDDVIQTGAIIKEKIQSLLNAFNCSLDDAIMVTDTAPYMITAFGELNQVFCINHLLENVVENSVKKVEEVAEISNLCLKIAKYNNENSKENYNFNLTVKALSHTWWLDSIFYPLEFIEKNWAEIQSIWQGEKKELEEEVTNINIDYIREIIKVLKPFEEACKKLEGEKYATLHLVHAYITGLKTKCLADDGDIDVIKRLKETLYGNISSIIINKLSITHRLALFLFPPANKLIHFNAEEKRILKLECSRQLKSYMTSSTSDINIKEENPDESPAEPQESSSSFISSYFVNSLTQSLTSNTAESKIANEIALYELLNVPFEENFNATQWWHLRQSQFPLLYKLSCKILSTPASSASSHRVFSSARHILAEKRLDSAYNPQTFNQIVFLHFNAETTFIANKINYNLDT